MSTIPFAPAGRRLRRCLLAAALAACALPAAASATTVSIDNNGTLRYFDGRGATNNLFAREDGSAIFITDTARVDPVSFAPGSIAHLCTRVNTSTVRCPFDAGPVRIKRFSAKMGDGNDSARVNVLSVPVEIEGQGGSDQYIGGGSSTLSRLRFRGGSGSDTAFYGPAQVGVRVSNDGVANDGRIGLDDENIDRDVERLSGSPFADDLTAGSDTTTQLRGGLGDDVLRAGAAATVFDMGPAADGADTILNGTGHSIVRYEQRTKPVNATIDHGGADDGEAGEGDEIKGRHETVEGGQAGDTLDAPRGSLLSYLLSGNGGNDTINGAGGNDTVLGGAGGDTVTTFGGNDRIITTDTIIDIVDCGSGQDTVELAAGGFIHVSCENRILGPQRAAG